MMSMHSQVAARESDLKLKVLQEAVRNNPDNSELLQSYLDEADAAGESVHAGEFLDHLLERHPWNHLIRKRFIANCLQQKNYRTAMDSIETLVAFSAPDDQMIDSALAVRGYLGPRSIESCAVVGPTLSLCMIVRDEQAFLGPCLNSIKTLVDEIILIDTGSNDRSVDIGRIYGAFVYAEKWSDDFSAARNVSLEQARGDWILILDADEIIDRQDHTLLRQTIQNTKDKSKAYSVETRNYSNMANAMNWHANDGSYPQQEIGNGWFPTKKVRLFPRSDAIRFVYPVHELVEPSIRAHGLSIEQSQVPVHHYGHLNETKNNQKAKRYFKLGYTKLEQLGDDKIAIRELAVQAGQLGYWNEAIELWHRLLTLSPDFGEAYANMAGAHWQMGDYEEGLRFARKAIRICPDLKEGHYNLAVNLLMNDQVEEATQVLQKLLLRHPQYLAAEFMLWISLILGNHHLKGRLICNSLEKKVSKQELKIAVGDLMEKLVKGGFADRFVELAKATGVDAAKHGHLGEI